MKFLFVGFQFVYLMIKFVFLITPLCFWIIKFLIILQIPVVTSKSNFTKSAVYAPVHELSGRDLEQTGQPHPTLLGNG